MIEIQIHPSDIRRRVRYFFFDRRRVVVGIVALSVVVAGLIGSMAAAPTVIRRVYKTNFLVEQLITVYGLDRTLGQGGFSTPIRGTQPDEEPLDDARRREVSLMNAMRRLQLQV